MQSKESKKESLLRCPFCGGEAKICGYYFIQCTKCGTSTLTHTNREEAIESWNTRKPMQEIVEKLEEMSGIQFDGENESYQLDWCIETKRAIEICKEVGGVNEKET